MSDVATFVSRLIDEGIFDSWHREERAPRWPCPECQFESNKFRETHERTCSQHARNRTEETTV